MEESLREKNELYSLPFHQKAQLKRSLHFLYGFIEVAFLGFILIPINDQEKSIINIIFLLFFIFFGYLWLAVVFFKKPFLTITDDYLEYRWLFGHKTIYLYDIYEIEFYYERVILKMGIRAKEQGKLTFWEFTDRMLGIDYSVSIVVSTFSNIDFKKLALTIADKAKLPKERIYWPD